MTKLFIALLFLQAFSAFVSANKELHEWPCYLKKCSRNNPLFNECLKVSANRGIQHLLPGDPNIAIPQLVPLKYEYMFGRDQTFKIFMDNALIYGINHLKVTHIEWDVDNKKISLKLFISNAILITGKFAAKGTYKDNAMPKCGYVDIALGDSCLEYNMSYVTKKFNDYDYATISNCKAKRKIEYANFKFFNHSSPDYQTANKLNTEVNKNWQDFDKAINLDLEILTCNIISGVFKRIFYSFPIQLMFD